MRKFMRRTTVLLVFLAISMVSAQRSEAMTSVGILEIIKAAVVKVIKAVDLKIQRLQNKTIWLQNAQKTLENTLSKMKLDEITEWTQKQKEQYQNYYEELKKVKSVISYYRRIKEVTEMQLRLVDEYNDAWQLLRQDKNFTNEELEYMGQVYGGILQQSMQNVEQISLVIKSYSLQMTDAKRLELIEAAAAQADRNYDDLSRFNDQNMKLSLQRAKTKQEADAIRKLYGLK